MVSREVERALKKQRLLQRSGELRVEWAQHARGVEPAFTAADALNKGWQWMKANPLLPVTVAVAVVVIRPVLVWRIGQGAWAGWKLWQRWRHLVDLPVSRPEEPR